MQILALNTVLVATDLRDTSLPAIEAARGLAKASGGTLHVVHVGAGEVSDGKATHEQLGRAGIPLDEAAVHTVRGEPGDAIAKLAAEIAADVIIVGPHATRAKDHRPALGTALAIATNAEAPCLIVTERVKMPVDCVVVAVDGSDTSRGAMVVALSWASGLRGSRITASDGVRLVALYVDSPPRVATDASTAKRMLDTIVQRSRDDAGTWAGVHIDGAIVTGSDVPSAIADYLVSNTVDMVVLGTRGSGLDDDVGRIGTVAGSVAQQVTIPTLLVPPAVWKAHMESMKSTAA